MQGRRQRQLAPILAIVAVYVAGLAALVSVEHNAKDAKILNLGDAVWYSIVTLTTVGYGDYYPVTAPGRAIGILFLIGTLGVLGVLIAKVSDVAAEEREKRRMGMNGTQMRDHIVIIGWNNMARSVTRQLLNAERQVAIVASSRDEVDMILQEYDDQPVFALLAAPQSVDQFEKAGISKASMVLVNLGDDTANLIVVLNTKARYSDRSFVVMLDNPDLRETFQSAGVTYTISATEISAKLLASYLFEPDVAELATELLSSTKSIGKYDLQQYLASPQGPYSGLQYGQALNDMRTNFRSLLVGISRRHGSGRLLLKLPPDDTIIEPGDYLMVITDGQGEVQLARHLGVKEGI